MNAVIRIAQIIAGQWFISMTLGALQKMNNEILRLVINMAGMASIALLFGYGRGKRGLRAGWIGWAFMLLVGGGVSRYWFLSALLFRAKNRSTTA